jgi:DNA invertase Pin-like site-specific DNA recombinase
MNDKIKAQHLERKAILYVRQSSAYQVTHNEESRRLQYAMRHRLEDLGWQEIEVVDDDLGRSAAGTVARAGFERMVAEVCLGKVGAVAAREVSRFARNSREWQQLVEVCRMVDTLLIDQDVIYAPRNSNDRLLLGLKGSLNEYELDLLRQRSLEARYEKARRGELVLSAPVGFLKTEDQRLELHPDERVQERIRLVFRKFLELGSIRQTLLWFLEEELQVPAHATDGTLIWKRPRYTSIHNILTNPAYGGAYAFGRTQHGSRLEGGQTRRASRRRERNEWIALIPRHHGGYISWEQFEQVQELIAGNCLGPSSPGAARRGAALLAGLLRCRRCGRKLTVSYTGGGRQFLRYSCVRGYLDIGEPKCIGVGGIPLDEAISREVIRVVQPAAIEAAVSAGQGEAQERDLALAALEQDLEAARYAARRAQKQFDAADPENRLVANELERRWNQALERVQELENRIAQQRCSEPTALVSPEDFSDLPGLLIRVWNDPGTDSRLKKRIVRTLLHEVLVDINEETNHIELVLHWQGGLHTELRLPRRRRGSATRTAPDVIQAVGILARICTDEAIAGFLNRNNLKTGRGNRWTKERVASLRSYHEIPCHDPLMKRERGWLTLTDAARFLGISSRTLRIAAEQGILPGEHPLSDGPWVFIKSDLQSPSAQQLAHRAQNRRGLTPAVPDPHQRNLDFSGT